MQETERYLPAVCSSFDCEWTNNSPVAGINPKDWKLAFHGPQKCRMKGCSSERCMNDTLSLGREGVSGGKYKRCVSTGFKPTQLSPSYCFLPPGLYCPLTQLSFYDLPPHT